MVLLPLSASVARILVTLVLTLVSSEMNNEMFFSRKTGGLSFKFVTETTNVETSVNSPSAKTKTFP